MTDDPIELRKLIFDLSEDEAFKGCAGADWTLNLEQVQKLCQTCWLEGYSYAMGLELKSKHSFLKLMKQPE